MGSLTERWLFAEEMLKQKSDQLSADAALEKCENDVDGILNSKTLFSSVDKDNQDQLNRLKVSLNM